MVYNLQILETTVRTEFLTKDSSDLDLSDPLGLIYVVKWSAELPTENFSPNLNSQVEGPYSVSISTHSASDLYTPSEVYVSAPTSSLV